MSAAALIYLGLVLVGLGVAMERHGKPRTGNYSVWGQIFGSSIVLALLYWGGFFAAVKP